MSRAAVAKHVAALRHLGYGIDARPGEGYRLLAVPDLPLPEEVAPLLTSRLWTRLEGGGPTGSTNDDAKALARAGAPEGLAVLASAQTRGRGRLGRRWESPPGGVYVSVLLRPQMSPADVPPLALAVALGVARGVERFGVSPTLKWPNDVLTDGDKLAGVLLETAAEADRAEWVVAGVGLNVRPAGARVAHAAYLEDHARSSVPLAAAAAAMLDGVAEAYERYLGAGFPGIRDAYESRSALSGREVVVRDAAGDVTSSGRVAGVDGSGRLVLEGPGGRVATTAGEVTLREEGADRT